VTTEKKPEDLGQFMPGGGKREEDGGLPPLKPELLETLSQVALMAKEYREAGQGIKAAVTLGDRSASFEVTPQPRFSSGGGGGGKGKQVETRKATSQDLQNIIMEYPDFMEIVDKGAYWIISLKKFAGDLWTPMMDKLRPFGAIWDFHDGATKKAWKVPK
jgi:hypothetical protein